jgi:hypothetical protein
MWCYDIIARHEAIYSISIAGTKSLFGCHVKNFSIIKNSHSKRSLVDKHFYCAFRTNFETLSGLLSGLLSSAIIFFEIFLSIKRFVNRYVNSMLLPLQRFY